MDYEYIYIRKGEENPGSALFGGIHCEIRVVLDFNQKNWSEIGLFIKSCYDIGV
jgi:hypothetical protein